MHLGENISAVDVELTVDEIAKIDSMERGARLYNPKVLDLDWKNFPYYD